MPISSGANGWPIRHFKQPPVDSEPKLKKFINVIPNEDLYNRPKPARPPSPKPAPVVYYTPPPPPAPSRKVHPSPSPPSSPYPPRRKQYTPSPSPESDRGDCCSAGGACGPGCCGRLCGNSVCCWSDDAYRKFGQRGQWLSGGTRGRGCCGGVCCRRILALLLGLLLLLLLLAFLLALIFGIQAYNRRSTTTIINGNNVYYTLLGKWQNCTDPASADTISSSLPLCNATTTVLVSTPSGFTTPYTEPTTAGQDQVTPLGGALQLVLLVAAVMLGLAR